MTKAIAYMLQRHFPLQETKSKFAHFLDLINCPFFVALSHFFCLNRGQYGGILYSLILSLEAEIKYTISAQPHQYSDQRHAGI